MNSPMRSAIDIAELKVQLQMAEQAVSAAKALLGKLEDWNDEASSERLTTSPGCSPQPGAGPRLIPVVDWPKHHPWPTVSGLRHLIYHASHNGFDQVICKIGSRILLQEDRFFQWAAEHNRKPVSLATPLPTQRSRAHSTSKAKR